MPELPEIETVKLQLQKAIVQCSVLNAQVLNQKTVQGDIQKIIGKKIIGVRRKGKVLIVDFEGGISVAFHFKMTGQLVYIPTGSTQCSEHSAQERIVGGHPTKDFIGELPSKHTRVVLELVGQGGKLYFNDQRKFGWVKIGTNGEINEMEFLGKLGPEIWEIDEDKFLEKLRKLKRPVKLAIMDQEVLSGVGNIYANDACWVAGVNPTVPSAQCSGEQIKALYKAIREVLEEGIKYGGATAADAKYIDLHGMGGHYQEHFKVYDRKGEKCLRNDGGVIEKISLGGRGTYWCPVCQK